MIKLKRALYQSEATGRKYRISLPTLARKRRNKRQPQLVKTWYDMRRRCSSPRCNRFQHYGARGIKVCDEWHDYGKFRDWALANGFRAAPHGSPTGDQPSIDRINVDEDYCPENCRWIKHRVNCVADRQGVRCNFSTGVPFADVQVARGMYAAGVSQQDIADAYGVTPSTVCLWVNYKTRVRA